MAKMSDAAVPSLLFTETANASIGTPAAGKARLFRDTDNVLKWKDEAGTVTSIGSGIAETLIDAKGDLIAGSAADTAARLAVGSNGKVLSANSAQATGLEWVTPSTGVGAKLYDYEVSGADKASIDTNVDGTTVASFAGYDILEVFAILRTDDAGAVVTALVTVNNDGSAIYDRQIIRANNTTLSGINAVAGTSWAINAHGSGGLAGNPAMLKIVIPAHTGTTFNKIGELVNTLTDSTAGNNYTDVWSIGYRSTAAITRVKVAANGAAKFKIGSRLIVYGR